MANRTRSAAQGKLVGKLWWGTYAAATTARRILTGTTRTHTAATTARRILTGTTRTHTAATTARRILAGL